MKDTINTYFALLLVTVIGAGAALLIIHLASANSLSDTFGGSEAAYGSLEQSILKN